MYVESVGGMLSGNTEFTSVRIAGIVNRVGRGSLFSCGIGLDNNAREYLTHGYLAHTFDTPDAMIYCVPADNYGPDCLAEVQQTLAATYGQQQLVDETGATPMHWPQDELPQAAQ